MNRRTTAAVSLAALVTLLAPSAGAAERTVAAYRCANEAGMTAWAWCRLSESYAAQTEGDLRLAVSLVDQAATYLATEPVVRERALVLRALLGRTLPGYAREAAWRCALLASEDSIVSPRVGAACRVARYTLVRLADGTDAAAF